MLLGQQQIYTARILIKNLFMGKKILAHKFPNIFV